ncbi:hypothetical protein QWY85_02785 [Neolewinella lacunae]|uniref:hypothetical protein n=1 Tax=Neolewinella lacunae TaxID=1517758 RepID=UPI001CA42256|nr:hypothetical protein [Neolewinella lacunae]MDN3633567.1 hypothetical protein [Neolewinella lacunae]
MSALKDKYIHPLTDFGFKKLFGSERLFEAAEIANFSPGERDAYEDSLKYYRDLKNVVDTSREEGVQEGMEKGIEQSRIEIARKMKQEGEPIEKIMAYTNLSREEIVKL